MQQIQQSVDPAQKRELLAQHLAALGEEMRLIRSQQAGMKMGMKEGSKGDGGMMGGGMMMHKNVEQRLNILERMLEQMIAREAVEASMDNADPQGLARCTCCWPAPRSSEIARARSR